MLQRTENPCVGDLTLPCSKFETWYNRWRPHMRLNGLRPDDVYYSRKPEKPSSDSKTAPCNIERHVFEETRITGYRLKSAAQYHSSYLPVSWHGHSLPTYHLQAAGLLVSTGNTWLRPFLLCTPVPHAMFSKSISCDPGEVSPVRQSLGKHRLSRPSRDEPSSYRRENDIFIF